MAGIGSEYKSPETVLDRGNDRTSFAQCRFDHCLKMVRGRAARTHIARSDQLDESLTAQIMTVEFGMVDAEAAPASAQAAMAKHMVKMAKADHDARRTRCRVAFHHFHKEGAGMETVRPLRIKIAIKSPHPVEFILKLPVDADLPSIARVAVAL